jgi:hypothetical protein
MGDAKNRGSIHTRVPPFFPLNGQLSGVMWFLGGGLTFKLRVQDNTLRVSKLSLNAITI